MKKSRYASRQEPIERQSSSSTVWLLSIKSTNFGAILLQLRGRGRPRLQPCSDHTLGAPEDGKHPEFFLAGSQLCINPHHIQTGIEWPHGVVGYHVRFTCERSPVRTRMRLLTPFLVLSAAASSSSSPSCGRPRRRQSDGKSGRGFSCRRRLGAAAVTVSRR